MAQRNEKIIVIRRKNAIKVASNDQLNATFVNNDLGWPLHPSHVNNDEAISAGPGMQPSIKKRNP